MSTDVIINTYNYSYDTNWKDQLINYNGNDITYDEIGNPLTYGNNITYTWLNGRELETYTDTSKDLEVVYSYNDSGIRTSKIINGLEHKYYLEGTNIIYETIGENTLYYFYDATGSIEGFKYSNDLYYYIKNGQNDIIGIIDDEGNQVVSYTYDSWGQVISITDDLGNEITDPTHIGNINPFRYRSYYYDGETGLYYLNSRYYNSETGRFVNADSSLIQSNTLLGNNLFAYAYNNPVNYVDETGHGPIKWLAKQAWKLVAKVIDVVGMKISAEMLSNSLKKEPKPLTYSDNSNVVKQVKNDASFKNKIKEAVSNTTNGSLDLNDSLKFSTTDLQGSLNKAKITATGNLINGCGILNVSISDTYDFKYNSGYYSGFKGFVFTVGNNMAWSDQYFGVINNYDVYINFDYNTCPEGGF